MKAARTVLIIAAILGSLTAAYWLGYEAGLNAKGPDHRALMLVRRSPGNPNSMGASATWFDVSKPADAARLQKEEERLKSIGAEYYVAKGAVTSTLSPEPRIDRVDSHR